MNKTKLGILEDILIKNEKIKSEDSSLRVKNTSEGLQASITCIESNKLEQENSTKDKNIIPTDKSFWESGHYDTNGNKTPFSTRMRLINFIECEPSTEYFVLKHTFIIRGFNKEREVTENIGVITASNTGTTFTTDENTYLLGVAVDKAIEEYDEEVDQFMICKNSEADKTWEKGYVDMPSMKYKSEVEGVTGDVKLKIQNKNIAYDVIYFNPTEQFRPSIRCNYQLKKDRYYAVSCDTENTGEKIYPNFSAPYGFSNISGWTNNYHQICDGKRKFWITKSVDSNIYKNRNLINKSNTTETGNTDGVACGYTYNLMIEEIPNVTTNEEALKYIASKYVEHKEQNFNIFLGNKTLYKGDKIVRKNGNWYFSYIWKRINDFSKLFAEIIAIEGKRRGWLALNSNFKLTDSNNNKNGGMSNITKLARNGQTYNGEAGFTVGSIGDQKRLFIYMEELSDIQTSQELQNALTELGAYFVLPLENEELELMEDEDLIKQLDSILLYMTEYEELTNFDFDQDVTFEIEVEKDNIRLLNSRLDELEKQSITTSALALESEV